MFLVGLRINHIAARLGGHDALAEKEFQVALLQARDLVEGGLQPFAEDVLAGLARDELHAVAAQRKDGVGGIAGRLVEGRHRHRRLVGLDARETLLGNGIIRHFQLSGSGFGIEVEHGGLHERHRSRTHAPGALVGQGGAYAQVFLRITGIGPCQRPFALDRHVDGQRGARIGDDDTAGPFIGAQRGDVGILRRSARGPQQKGGSQGSEFHGLRFYDSPINKDRKNIHYYIIRASVFGKNVLIIVDTKTDILPLNPRESETIFTNWSD